MLSSRFISHTGLLCLICMLTACSVHYEVAENKLTYQKDIQVDILKVQSSDGQSAWGNRMLVPPKGHTFVNMWLLLTNNTNSEEVVDLTKIYLLNADTKMKYPVAKIYQATLVVIGAGANLKLSPGEQTKRVLMFSYPKKQRPELLEMNGTMYKIAYK